MNDQELEIELRKALGRIEPGKDFSALVYERRGGSVWMRPRVLLALAAGLILALVVPWAMRYQARQRQAEEARKELVTALRITGSKLQKTRQMVVHGLSNRRNSI